MSERMDVTIMGVQIGTADGWDQADENAIQFNDFNPLPPFDHVFEPCASVHINHETGVVTMYIDVEDEEGEEEEAPEQEEKKIPPLKLLEILVAAHKADRGVTEKSSEQIAHDAIPDGDD